MKKNKILKVLAASVLLGATLTPLASCKSKTPNDTTQVVEDYKVTFVYKTTDGTVLKTETKDVKSGDSWTKQDVTYDGYDFNGWYTDENMTQEVQSNVKVTSNVTLYAKFTKTETPAPTPAPEPTPNTPVEDVVLVEAKVDSVTLYKSDTFKGWNEYFKVTKNGEDIAITDLMITSNAVAGAVGSYTVTCTYNNVQKTINVNVIEDVYEITSTTNSIVLESNATLPDFKTYFAVKKNETTDIEVTDDMITSNVDMTTPGDYTVTLACNGVQKTINVTVNSPVEVVEVEAKTQTVTIKTGDTLDAWSTYFSVKYNEQDVQITDDMIDLGGLDVNNVGEYVITLTYKDAIAQFKVIVEKADDVIVIETTTDHVDFYQSTTEENVIESFLDLFTITVNGINVNVTKDMITSNIEFGVLGDYTITCTYGEQTASVSVSIIKNGIKSIVPLVEEITLTEGDDIPDFKQYFKYMIDDEEQDITDDMIITSLKETTLGVYFVTCQLKELNATISIQVKAKEVTPTPTPTPSESQKNYFISAKDSVTTSFYTGDNEPDWKTYFEIRCIETITNKETGESETVETKVDITDDMIDRREVDMSVTGTFNVYCNYEGKQASVRIYVSIKPLKWDSTVNTDVTLDKFKSDFESIMNFSSSTSFVIRDTLGNILAGYDSASKTVYDSIGMSLYGYNDGDYAATYATENGIYYINYSTGEKIFKAQTVDVDSIVEQLNQNFAMFKELPYTVVKGLDDCEYGLEFTMNTNTIRLAKYENHFYVEQEGTGLYIGNDSTFTITFDESEFTKTE